MNHQGTVRLETERLMLRRFSVGDAEEMYQNWASSADVARFMPWEPHADAGETAALLRGWVKDYEKPDCYNWVLERKADGILAAEWSAQNAAAK